MKFAVLALASVVSIALVPPVEGQCSTPGVGGWSDTYEWREFVVELDSNGASICPNDPELSHAAVLPTGIHAGKVLLWKKQVQTQAPPGSCSDTRDTAQVWMFDPSMPNQLISIAQQLSSDIFCAGLSWDRRGQLVVAGGVPTGNETNSFPPETYRFIPKRLGPIAYNLETGMPYIGMPVSGSLPWRREGDMEIERYYPSLLTLNNDTVYFSGMHSVMSMQNTSMGAGQNLVLGGPPDLNDPGFPMGNEFWEVLPMELVNEAIWYDPIKPNEGPSPNATYLANPNGDLYDLVDDGSGIPSALLDSYPRAVQMSNGHILICGDVDTADAGLGTPGMTWVIKPRTSLTLLPNQWELHHGP